MSINSDPCESQVSSPVVGVEWPLADICVSREFAIVKGPFDDFRERPISVTPQKNDDLRRIEAVGYETRTFLSDRCCFFGLVAVPTQVHSSGFGLVAGNQLLWDPPDFLANHEVGEP